MATSKQSFWQLIENHKICIPIIQRDYAQGRKEEHEKRDKFLESIFKHITNQETLQLDFVYGRVKNDVFYPIDGQQRLTTLFLLHWYFAVKEEVDVQLKFKLSRFIYDTRISSREFCQAIVNEEIILPKETGRDLFINDIKKQYWFRSSWNTDPTINAMLIMLQAIHNKFNTIQVSLVFNDLTENNIITFEVLDLGKKEFDLTDELYIKMNSRGKQLTSFENFKANFIQLVDKHYENKRLKHPIKGEISFSGYFSYKIEKEWTDLFWSFRDENEFIIDSKFFSYFEFVAQMCYFKKYKDAKVEYFNNNFVQYEDVFQHEENILFLFNSLDKLHTQSLTNSTCDRKNINLLFQTISNQVNLFWNTSDNNNLFERIISNHY